MSVDISPPLSFGIKALIHNENTSTGEHLVHLKWVAASQFLIIIKTKCRLLGEASRRNPEND